MPEAISSMVRKRDQLVTERITDIRGHFVPLPSPEDGLADLLAQVVPPFALTLSTPFVRVPVTRPPTFTDDDLQAQVEFAARCWAANRTAGERRRRLRAIETDRETHAGRYERMSADHTWLMLALRRSGTSWEEALVLADRLTAPPLDWFSVDQAATNDAALRPSAFALPLLGDPRSPREHVLSPYRRVALTVLADVGAYSASRTAIVDDDDDHEYPDDENRNPSRLVQAARVCGISRSNETAQPSKAAANARDYGRRLLHAVGVWPWESRANGELEGAWWAEPDVVDRLRDWLRQEEARDSHERESRSAAAKRAGLT